MKVCACKGIRTCLQCEPLSGQNENDTPETINEFIYCWKCSNKAYPASGYFDSHDSHHQQTEDVIEIDGVFLQEEVITFEEEQQIVVSIDANTWMDSQSGRRKQDFGPKINFKKKKINFESFAGLPQLDMTILERIKESRLRCDDDNVRFEWKSIDAFKPESECENILRNFKTVEVCHLEYIPERGSAIDPHFDDFWIWGERLVTLNLVSSTVIRLSHEATVISVPLPARSFLVLYGEARFKFKHSIQRQDVHSRRLAITYRELPREFLEQNSEDYQKYGKYFIEKSQNLLG